MVKSFSNQIFIVNLTSSIEFLGFVSMKPLNQTESEEESEIIDNEYYETTDLTFLNECLKIHNQLRKFHGAKPFRLDKKVCSL